MLFPLHLPTRSQRFRAPGNLTLASSEAQSQHHKVHLRNPRVLQGGYRWEYVVHVCVCVCVRGDSHDLGIGLVPRESTLALLSYKDAQRLCSLLPSQPGRGKAGPEGAAAPPLGHVADQGMVSRALSFQPCHGALSAPCCLNTKYPYRVGWGSSSGRWLNPGDGPELGGVWDNVWKWSSGDSFTFPERSLGPTAQDAP